MNIFLLTATNFHNFNPFTFRCAILPFFLREATTKGKGWEEEKDTRPDRVGNDKITMPQTLEPIQPNTYYHIYNRGINGETLFRENTNYEHFFRLYEKYVDPVADTFAWVMMQNHFHFLVRIKDEEEIEDIPRKQPLPGHKATGRVSRPKTPPAVENPGGG